MNLWRIGEIVEYGPGLHGVIVHTSSNYGIMWCAVDHKFMVTWRHLWEEGFANPVTDEELFNTFSEASAVLDDLSKPNTGVSYDLLNMNNDAPYLATFDTFLEALKEANTVSRDEDFTLVQQNWPRNRRWESEHFVIERQERDHG